jgi:hypothetical protein
MNHLHLVLASSISVLAVVPSASDVLSFMAVGDSKASATLLPMGVDGLKALTTGTSIGLVMKSQYLMLSLALIMSLEIGFSDCLQEAKYHCPSRYRN